MMGERYTKYSDYKESGEKWIGKVPELWDVQRLGQFFEERREKVSDKDYPPLSVTMNGIVPQLETAAKTDAGDNRKLVLKNDFVINSRSDRKGSSGVSTLDGSVSLISIVMKPRGIRPSYVHHLLRSYPFQEEFYRFGKGIVADLWSTNASEMRNIKLPIPSLHEQEQIANFLDHETAKIDTLIDKQQQLIKLLKEKRQTVISYAITKGLNPDAPMKDSGVEWLGEVPAHWIVARAKHVSDIFVPQRNKPELNKSEGLFWTTMEDMKTERIVFTTNFVSDSAMKTAGSKKLQPGSVIASCVGNFGIASINDVEVVINQQLQAFIPHDIEAEYLRLQVTISKAYFEIVGTSATLVYVNQEGFANLPVIVPPQQEQKEIVASITLRSDKFSHLIKRVEQAIDLMQERRTTLISAAVTGKIDVRNWQPAQTEIPREVRS
jgi:type I restriction enzyme S subunit